MPIQPASACRHLTGVCKNRSRLANLFEAPSGASAASIGQFNPQDLTSAAWAMNVADHSLPEPF
eukprot:172722-Pleurochrysis_carterae.AAC.1